MRALNDSQALVRLKLGETRTLSPHNFLAHLRWKLANRSTHLQGRISEHHHSDLFHLLIAKVRLPTVTDKSALALASTRVAGHAS